MSETDSQTTPIDLLLKMKDSPDYGPNLQDWRTSTPNDSLVISLTRAYQEILGSNSRRIGSAGPGGEPSLKSMLDAQLEVALADEQFMLSHGARLFQAYFGPVTRPDLPRELRQHIRSLCIFVTLLERAGRNAFASDAEKRQEAHGDKGKAWWKTKKPVPEDTDDNTETP